MNEITQLPGYSITKQIYEGSQTLVYRAVRSIDGIPVVIKLLRNPFPNFHELVQFRNQYTIAKNIDLPSVVKMLVLEPYGNAYALVMEDFGGISLQDLLTQAENLGDTPETLKVFLQIALQIVAALDGLGRNRIIHKDIKPANILIHPDTKQVKLIDFSIASLLPRETQEIQNANALEGTLAYLSPEQTGRMNRGVDYRSDFYSLGVTLYELLTGKLPFTSQDPMEMVHCHLAKNPPLVHEINPSIPLVLSEIINKLMAKNAEDRYQSALGIKHDLEICLEQLQSTEEIKFFKIGEGDVSDRFTIPEKLYGREQEVQALLNAFDRVSTGNTEMMLVAGFSGIGKTAVVNEVHKPISRQHGYFIKGKYDQFQRNIPFSAFVQAFRDLMGQLLSESDLQLNTWKSKILEVVGDNGQVLIEVIPELELIIGKQPPATELSGSAAQNRFNLLIQKFFQVFTSQEHPLVMFIDDLQWADSASLNLLKLLMQDTQYLLILGAYRDNEVSPDHPFIITVGEIVKTGAVVNTITLQPLSLLDTNYLVADTLKCELSIAQPLTELVYQKTIGNPFFTTQFLKSLYGDKLIIFDSKELCWQCDITKVQTLAITDDVIEFMALQLQRLPRDTQNALKLAACIGSEFNLHTLAIISEKSRLMIATVLWRALQEGFIIPITKTYKFFAESDNKEMFFGSANPTYHFLHDRVQQAAYSLIPDDQKQMAHYHIGQILLREFSEQQQEEKIFDIVNHLSIGINQLQTTLEREELANLALLAGQKAKSATAYATAVGYFNVAIEMASHSPWQKNYTLNLKLHEQAAETAYLIGQFSKMEQLIDSVLQHARTVLDRVNVYEIMIQGKIAQNNLPQALEIALLNLQQLGIEFPDQPTQNDARFHLESFHADFSRYPIEWLSNNSQQMQDDIHLAQIKILASVVSAAYQSASPLLTFFITKQIELSIKFGNTPISAFSYIWYGLIISGILKDIDSSFKIGQLALRLLSIMPNPAINAKVLNMAYAFNQIWKQPVRDALQPLIEGYQRGIEMGDMEYASYAAYNHCGLSYCAGIELESLAKTMQAYGIAIKKLKQKTALNFHRIFWQSTINWLETSEDPSCLMGEVYREAEMLPIHQLNSDRYAICTLYINKLILAYGFEYYQLAREYAVIAEEYAPAVAGSFKFTLIYFYNSLAQLTAYESVDGYFQKSILEHVVANQAKLEVWAVHAPMNHQHKVDLVEAEKCRVLGNRAEAIELYDKAIAGAKENEYIQEEALANELAAKFYLDWGKEKVAQVYMTEAYYCYSRWGAKAKVADLKQRYPQLLQSILQQPKTSFNPLETLTNITRSSTQIASTSISDTLDFASVIKAAQALSSMIELDELLQQLTQIILQNSGGSRCVLILPDRETWHVRAITTPETTELCSIPLDEHPEVPIKLIQYVKRTQSVVAIDNLQTDLPVIDDYLIQRNPKSILCLPILDRGHLAGILYLKNHATAGVFTSDRLTVIEFLCTQAAISLENARLYQESQTYAQELEQTQLQMIQSEKMSALGNLVAGVAHEINNPVGFLSGNIQPALDYINDLFGLLDLYQQKYPQADADITEEIEAINLEYVREDLPKLIGSMKTGVDRIRDISSSLRTFSRADSDRPVAFNLHEGIDSTILILKHRLKADSNHPEIAVIKNYGQIPTVECYAGQLNQVFMNIIANAIDALDESNTGRSYTEIEQNPNSITITTSVENNYVKIAITDNGKGMSEEVKQKVFDHLFTTKEVGKGTGLGLAIAQQIIVEKHQGTITVNSTLGKGTEFLITLPIS